MDWRTDGCCVHWSSEVIIMMWCVFESFWSEKMAGVRKLLLLFLDFFCINDMRLILPYWKKIKNWATSMHNYQLNLTTCCRRHINIETYRKIYIVVPFTKQWWYFWQNLKAALVPEQERVSNISVWQPGQNIDEKLFQTWWPCCDLDPVRIDSKP